MKITVHLEAEDIVRIITSYVQDNLHIQGTCEFTYTPSPLWVEVTQDEDELEPETDEELEPDQSNIFTWIDKQVCVKESGLPLGAVKDIQSTGEGVFTLILDSFLETCQDVNIDGTDSLGRKEFDVCLK
jgi:hypothetical protein